MAERAVGTIYDFLPSCRERGCRWEAWDEDVRHPRQRMYQHGDNPEAVVFIDLVSSDPRPWEVAQQRIQAFAERCHRYEDGE